MVKTLKVLLILFDGAEWNVIHPLVRAGRLPHLAAFMRAGCYGRLRSLDDVALASPILWTSMATGKLPHKHGVKDFYDTAASVRTARIWEIFERDGLRIGLFRYLITWPPRPTNGFIVPDWCARTPETYPAELSFINMLASARSWPSLVRNGVLAVRHGVGLATALLGVREAVRARLFNPTRLANYFRQRLLELAIHTDIFRHLVRRYQPDFAAFYSGLPDAVHHQYWKFMEPEKFGDVTPSDVNRYGGVIPRVYEELDRKLGLLLQLTGQETLVVIASDHGGEANIVEEYRWAAVRGEELIKVFSMPSGTTSFRIGAKTYFRCRPVSELSLPLPSLAEQLGAVTLDGSSIPIFKVELHGVDELAVEVIYLKQCPDHASLRLHDGRQVPIGQLLDLTPTISGNHSMHGILLLRGPNVRQNCEIYGASLLDVTPTILALLGRAVGKDMDGRVLVEAIDPNFLRRHPVQSIESYDMLLGRGLASPASDSEVGIEEVKARLRALGYIE